MSLRILHFSDVHLPIPAGAFRYILINGNTLNFSFECEFTAAASKSSPAPGAGRARPRPADSSIRTCFNPRAPDRKSSCRERV